ncbi:MAG: glycosyltransferase [Chthoniobacterales bacterium]
MLTRDEFFATVAKRLRANRKGTLACITFQEADEIEELIGHHFDDESARQLVAAIHGEREDYDTVDCDGEGHILVFFPDANAREAKPRLMRLADRIAHTDFVFHGSHWHLTPVIGFAEGEENIDVKQLFERALSAMQHAYSHSDLHPKAYTPDLAEEAEAKRAAEMARKKARRWRNLWEKHICTPAQVVASLTLGFVIPFCVYALLALHWYDITSYLYIFIVVCLITTVGLIWVENFLALKRVDPPPPSQPYPVASAIIAAYLPNEAATVLDTVHAFLRIDYPARVQIILAYNTPHDMAVEKELQELAKQHSNFLPYRVSHSASKAENVNAALSVVEGEFVGVFDADHQPDPDNYQRAWRWLSNGYDVVQGHCLVRNGEQSRVARIVAIEFEQIYAVSHPGRARLHGFGIFGGTNGYWKTALLHRTRMNQFMLTEDIDASLRVVIQGYKIASDPYLVSRELGPVTFKALWNQRLRWAQGWFQTSLKHIVPALRSEHLTLRQKLGLIHLLPMREAFPWLSIQIIPVIAFKAWWLGGLQYLDWQIPIFVLTTVLTLSTSPVQAVFAYILADPQIKKRKNWFGEYMLHSFFYYSEFKNLISRVAHIKEAMHERAWKVTPRGAVKKAEP